MAICLLKLSGVLQRWSLRGHHSEITVTNRFPTKSGLVGILLACLGVDQADQPHWLKRLNALKMGARADQPGRLIVDHKVVRKTLEMEGNQEKKHGLMLRQQLLSDASFIVALQGDSALLGMLKQAVENPVYLPFLGQKRFLPDSPFWVGFSDGDTLLDALASHPWEPRPGQVYYGEPGEDYLLAEVEDHREQVHDLSDVIVTLHPHLTHRSRLVGWARVRPPVVSPPEKAIRGTVKEETRIRRFLIDEGLSGWDGLPGYEMHHEDYSHYGHELDNEVRTVSRAAHKILTSLGTDEMLKKFHYNPNDPAQVRRFVEMWNIRMGENL